MQYCMIRYALRHSLLKVLYSVRFLSGNNGFYGFDLLAGVVHGHGGPAPPHPTAPSSAATSVPPNGVSEDYYP